MMKFTITMKDPDGPIDSIREEAEKNVDEIGLLDDDERDRMIEVREEKLREFAGQWLTHGEYIDVEFDTDAGTATVLPSNR